MKQALVLAAILSVSGNGAAAQTVSRPMQTVQTTTGSTPAMTSIAKIDVTGSQIRALQDQVAALKQQLAEMSAKMQSIDSGLGQVLTQNISQSQQINKVNQDLGAVSTKLATHRHSYTWYNTDYTNVYVLKESSITSEEKDLVSYITGNHEVAGKTGPAE